MKIFLKVKFVTCFSRVTSTLVAGSLLLSTTEAFSKACPVVSGDKLEASVAAKYQVVKTDIGNWVAAASDANFDTYSFQHTYYFRMRGGNCFEAVKYQSGSRSWEASARSMPDEHPGCDDRWVRRVVSYYIKQDAINHIKGLMTTTPNKDVTYYGRVEYQAENLKKNYNPEFHFSIVINPEGKVKAGSLRPTKICM